MKKMVPLSFLLLLLWSVPSQSQSHFGQWVERNASDTTLVPCRGDSLSMLAFPPNCMGMGMMYPDSLYCQFRDLPLDSLHHPSDSTFLCWRRLQLGSDSMHFTYMHCDSGYGNGNFMMGFQRAVECRIHWDSTEADSIHRTWHPSGIRCWDGTRWITIPGVSIEGNTLVFSGTEVYSAIAIVGEPATVTGVSENPVTPAGYLLAQNYPNPFNPQTTIGYRLPMAGRVLITVYDVLGREVRTIVDQWQDAGYRTVRFDGNDMPSGVYFCRLRVSAVHAGFSAVIRMVLAR